jgi:hypothetical protein
MNFEFVRSSNGLHKITFMSKHKIHDGGHRGPAGKGMVLFRIATGILGSNLSRPTNFSTVIGDAISL